MNFKIDKNLSRIINESRISRLDFIQPVESASRSLYLYCVESGLFPDSKENHGKTVGELTAKKNVFEVCQTLASFLGKSVIPSEIFDAFCNLIIE